MDPPGQKGGRHAKYSRDDLERVAELYRYVYGGNVPESSRAPTKYVAETLGISRNRAAKLVMKCRDPQIGLLAPTVKRKAGGIVPPEAEGGA